MMCYLSPGLFSNCQQVGLGLLFGIVESGFITRTALLQTIILRMR